MQSRQALDALLSEVEGVTSLPDRLDRLSAGLLGRPYITSPLIGSATEPEQFVDRIDGFDCVTYIETVLALARCRSVDDFVPELTALRYDGAQVDWKARNHYMSWWLERNVAAGIVEPLLADELVPEPASRMLSALPGFPPQRRRLHWLPSARAFRLDSLGRTGDVVCFVSVRPGLDTFHVGMVVSGPKARLRHASKSRGGVVEEPLVAFLAREETPGLLLARPLERS
jgi:hypothetical protein